MDIIKAPNHVSIYRRFWYIPVVIAIVAAVALVAGKYQNVTYFASLDSLLLDQVRAGDLQVSVRGYGQLASSDVYWIGAETQGRVARILAKPGDLVTAGEVLIELFNPELLQDLNDAELEYAAKQAEFRANQVARETELLDLQTEAAGAEIDHQTAKMDLDAKTSLISRGMQIISSLEYESSQLAVEKYRQRMDMQVNRVNQSRHSIIAMQEAEQARLAQTRNDLQKTRDQVQNLSVRASVDGIVQEMNLALGQQIASGQNITRIARPDQLVAEVKIQELQVNDISIGMPATVDTRSSQIAGVVSRIDPAVVDGSVLVEIELQGQLPPEVRPDLNIEANISVAHVEDTLSVLRPVFARAHSTATVYRLTASGDIAERISVQFGEASTNHIEILEGLSAGDRIIISDPGAFDTHDRIYIR